MLPACYLYVPGDRPDRFDKAVASGAGAVILDLEDAVAVAAKSDARAAVVAHLQRGPAAEAEQWVRINTGERGLEDLAAIAALPGTTGVFVPKATRAELGAVSALSSLPLCALVESAATVLDLPNVASADGVVALAMGEVDLAADLGAVPSDDEHELWPFRMQVVAVSVAARRRAPIGPVFTAINDIDGLRRSTVRLRRAGFGSRQAIHPAQVTVINDVMTPTDEEVEEAEATLRLVDAAGGGVCVDAAGRMVDEAVLRQARRILGRRPLS
ncbi:MAG: HpcH/HpaI aldolase/citrate lyase family protein [Microthrixaceae bacterium]